MNIEINIIGKGNFKYTIDYNDSFDKMIITAIKDTTDYKKYGTPEFTNTNKEYKLEIDSRDLNSIVLALQKLLY